MKYLEAFGAALQAILFIMSWRVTLEKEKHDEAKKLAADADDAIRAGRFDDVIVIWSRMRNLK